MNRQTALEILNANADSLPNLIEQAYQLRTKYKGNRVSIQLHTNVRSGNCTQNCAYCAQSRDSKAPIEKYRYVEDKKLYGDNNLVDEMQLARHCIGLSGIRFADDDIEKLAERDISALTPEYCIKVLCLARLLLPKSDIRCAAGREVYFKGREKTLFKIADSIFASGYLTEGGQSLEETFRIIEAAGFTWQVESA